MKDWENEALVAVCQWTVKVHRDFAGGGSGREGGGLGQYGLGAHHEGL